MYKQDFQQITPGVKAEFSHAFSEQADGALSFTYHAPINFASEAIASDGVSNTYVPTKLSYNFKTILLNGRYYINDLYEEGFNAFGTIGVGFVLVNAKEKLKGQMPAGYTLQQELYKENLSGLIGSLGVGAQYRIGPLVPFVDANLSYPASEGSNNYYSYNPIPLHFHFNAGVRFVFGSEE